MRWTHGLLLLLGGFLLLPDLTWSQSQGKGRGKGKQIAADPQKFFDLLSGGKDVIVMADLDPQRQKMVQSLSSRYGVKMGDRMTREEFKQHVSTASSMVKSGAAASSTTAPNNSTANPSGGSGREPVRPKSGQGQASRANDRAEEIFRQLDTDHNGVLTADEIPEEMRHERAVYDANHDGRIDLNEFKVFFSDARSARAKAGPGDEGNRAGARPAGERGPGDLKPAAYRENKLPKGLPEWFARLDKQGDCDGQVGLWEARRDQDVFNDFAKMDLNGDGLLTSDELLRWQAIQKRKLDGPGAATVARSGQLSTIHLPADGVLVSGDFPARVVPSLHTNDPFALPVPASDGATPASAES